MALQSPGVQVTVIDESVYTTAEAGTTPLIVVATAQNKTNASNTGIAQGTLKTNAGRAYRISSQRELVDVFGVPTFKKTATGAPIHGGEQNEYGLQAAYSLLGVTNSAFIVRADIDLNELAPSSDAPGSEPADGQWWLDTAATTYGTFEWDASAASDGGQRFVNKSPIVLTLDDADNLNNPTTNPTPKANVGRVGDYAVVASTDVIRIFYKGQAYGEGTPTWALVGSQQWRSFWPAAELGVAGDNSGTVTMTIGLGLDNADLTSITINSNSNATAVAAAIGSLVEGVVVRAISSTQLAVYAIGSDSDPDTGLGQDDSTAFQVLRIGGSGIDSVFPSITGSSKTFYLPDFNMGPHTAVPQWKESTNAPRPTGSVWVKTTEPNAGARWKVKKWSGSAKIWQEVSAPLYGTSQEAIFRLDPSKGGLGIPQNSVYVQYNYEENTGYDTDPATATFKIFYRKAVGVSAITSEAVTSITAKEYVLNIAESVVGSRNLSSAVEITVGSDSPATAPTVSEIVEAINGAGLTNVEAVLLSNNRISIRHNTGGEIRIADQDDLFGELELDTAYTSNLYSDPSGAFDYIVSSWAPLAGSYEASNTSPINDPVDGQLWYSSRIDEVDVMVHNGTTWKGYRQIYPGTDPNGPIISATRPTTYSDGSTSIAGNPSANGQLWISTADLENYPTIYRWNNDTQKWDLIDKTDQTTENGIIFADARAGTDGGTADTAPEGTISELLDDDFLDFDAPDPTLYPLGMLLWNTRRSGFNVKRYVVNHVDTDADNALMNEGMDTYYPNRWVTASSNQEDGSGSFGRKAQRKVVVEALKALVDTNQDIREEESRAFNLISCPGYPELLSNLVGLNLDRGTTAFVVGDTPFNLTSDTTSLTNWGNNANDALDNGDKGLITRDAYASVFYPSGRSTDNTGSEIVVPASHMMLRTIALSDQVSYPWFAPAGTRRGGITNATAVGYVNRQDGEFKVVSLTEGQRDALYNVSINPITFFNGVGLVNYGQKTLSGNASALDRINVARLVVYLRSQLNKLAKPFVFEPNDKITRDEVKQAVESLLLELVGLRALYDFAVVCDETNNTPQRIDRNELYVDIAIEPVKAIEFIYIPLRLKNTGEIQSSLNS